MANSFRGMSILELLSSSPWPLRVCDIASALEVDESTAASALGLLISAGRAKQNGDGWIIR